MNILSDAEYFLYAQWETGMLVGRSLQSGLIEAVHILRQPGEGGSANADHCLAGG